MMVRPARHEHGQTTAASAVLIMLLILVAGGVVDLYRLQETRDWAYRAAESAALVGAARGRDLSTIYTIGQPRLDPGVGYTAAESVVQDALTRRGVTGATYQIETLEWGGTVTGFPPVARADLWGAGDWSSSEPSVGVYLDVPVQTFLLGLAQQGLVHVHVFAASSVSTP